MTPQVGRAALVCALAALLCAPMSASPEDEHGGAGDLDGARGPGGAVPLSAGPPAWARGSYWVYVADQEVRYCATLGAATLVVTHVSGSLTETLSGVEAREGYQIFRVEGSLAQTVRGNLTVYIGGYPVTAPVSWPLIGNTTELLRTGDLATVYSYAHISLDMGTLGTVVVDTSSSYSPPLESYRFPLRAGLEWRINSTVATWTRTSGAMGAFELNTTARVEAVARVCGEETAPVPAGSLDCLNVTHNGTSTTAGEPPEPYNRTLLYSPAAETAAVKSAGLSFSEVSLGLSDFRVNHAPVATPPLPLSIAEDTVDSSINLSGVFQDPDPDDSLRFLASGGPNVSASVDARTGALTLAPLADWCGSGRVLLRAEDGRGASCETEALVTVTPVNDPPRLSSPLGSIVMDEDTADETLNLSRHFSDPDLEYGDRLTFTFRESDPVGVEILPNSTARLTPRTNWSGFQCITFIAADGAGLEAEGALELAVRNLPDPPVCLCATHSLEAREDEPLRINLSERFWDADLPYGDELSFGAASALEGMGLELSRDGTLVATPPADFFGPVPLFLNATDGGGRVAREEATLTFLPINDPPGLVAHYPADRSQTLPENRTLEFGVAAVDKDSSSLTLRWWLDGESVGEGESFNYTPGFDAAGAHTLAIIISDGELSASFTWSLDVLNVNRPPEDLRILLPVSGARVQQGRGVLLRACATDPDGDPLTFVWRSSRGGALGSGEELEVKGLARGAHNITVAVQDGNATVEASVDITVVAPLSSGAPGPGAAPLLLALIIVLHAKRVAGRARCARK